jgi:hypothetical protein
LRGYADGGALFFSHWRFAMPDEVTPSDAPSALPVLAVVGALVLLFIFVIIVIFGIITP